MKLIVTGTRAPTLDDMDCVWCHLNHAHEEDRITLLIEGGARGVDAVAKKWAFRHDVPVATFHAHWQQLGKAAGHMRNRAMLEAHPDAQILAFPKGPSPGTRNCIAQARVRGREPFIVELLPCP